MTTETVEQPVIATAFRPSTKECGICTEKWSKQSRKPVVCSYCAHESCMTCVKTYLLQTVHQPHCMQCRKEWNTDFLNTILPALFLKGEYRQMREKILFEQEKTFLPALQPEAERLNMIERLENKIIKWNRAKEENQRNEDQMVRDQRIKDKEITTKIDELAKLAWNLEHKKIKNERKEFSIRCPIGECRGVLSRTYHCGLCDTDVCKDCHEKKTDEHICNPDDVATVTELENNTKPCPGCSTRIYKIDGCDQMFCIQCRTPFSWRTGLVESGIIHNPHYFEMLRAGNITDMRHRQDHGACGAMPDYRVIYKMGHSAKIGGMNQDEIQVFYQNTVHLRQDTMIRLAVRDDRSEDRINYLRGKMEEKVFKQRTFVCHQRGLRLAEERQVIDSHTTIMEEMFRFMTEETMMTNLVQMRTLANATKEALTMLDKKYQHKGLVGAKNIAPFPQIQL